MIGCLPPSSSEGVGGTHLGAQEILPSVGAGHLRRCGHGRALRSEFRLHCGQWYVWPHTYDIMERVVTAVPTLGARCPLQRNSPPSSLRIRPPLPRFSPRSPSTDPISWLLWHRTRASIPRYGRGWRPVRIPASTRPWPGVPRRRRSPRFPRFPRSRFLPSPLRRPARHRFRLHTLRSAERSNDRPARAPAPRASA